LPPLFSLGAALRTVDEPNEALALNGRQILQELARRERMRFEPYGAKIGFGPHGMSRLIALSSLRGDLSQQTIKNLAKPYLKLGWPKADDLLKIILEMPQWDERHSRLRAPHPDLLAAAFLEQVLDEAPQEQRREWVWVAIKDLLEDDSLLRNLVKRLERISQDIYFLQETPRTALSASLVEISKERHEALRRVPRIYDEYFNEINDLQLFAEIGRIAAELISEVRPAERLDLAERFSNQADLYERAWGISLRIYLPEWNLSLLQRICAEGDVFPILC
jgi:hypothetical protein